MLCPKCGKDVEEDAKFCGYCGYEFVKEKEKRKKIGGKGLIGAGILCISFGYLVGGIFGNFILINIGTGATIWGVITLIANLVKK